jgi:hypothetical protein
MAPTHSLDPHFTPGARLSRLPLRTEPQSLEDHYHDLFTNTGPEHDRQRLLQLLDMDVDNGAAAQDRMSALDHLNRAFGRIDAWTYQSDYLPQADRTELKRRVARNLLAARPEMSPVDETIQDIFGQKEQPGPLDDDLGKEFDLKGAKTYWTVQPNPDACEKCQAMAGKVFTEKPERPHPNCKCLIQEHKVRINEKTIKGKLCGFDDFSIERFTGGRNVKVTVSNEGPFAAIGIHVMPNTGQNQGSMILRGLPVTFYFATPESTPFDWKIMFLVRGGDTSCLNYTITYYAIEK